MLRKILIIDGNYILNRSFYATKKIINNSEKNIAVYIFFKIYYKFLKIVSPQEIIICFDKSSNNFRKHLYHNYKSNRKKMPNMLFDQFNLLKKILKFMNVQFFEFENFEADDIIGSLCDKFKKNYNCIILSGDKDLFQLIDDNVQIYYFCNNSKILIYDKELFLQKYNFDNKYFVDYKALIGDTSDNIPGIYGIGPITASKIICKFNTIDYIYNNIDTISLNLKLKTLLIKNKEKAYLSYNLSKIKTNIDLSIDFNNKNNLSKKKLYILFKKLNFISLLNKF